MTIEPLDFFMLRTPRLAANTINELNANRTPEALANYLNTCFQEPALQHAVAVTSGPLHRELMKFLEEGPPSLQPKLSTTLYKYLVRMAARATPFGLFAGVALGRMAAGPSDFTLSGTSTPALRLDMAFSAHLTRWAHNHTDIRKRIAYRLTNSLIVFEDHYRYMGYRLDNGNRHAHWIRMKRNILLDHVIPYTRETRTYRATWTFLTQMGLNEIQAENYINQLVDRQLLVPNTEPVATGKKPTADAVAATFGIPTDSRGCFAPSLDSAHEVIAAIPPAARQGFKGMPIQADLAIGTDRNQLSWQTARRLTQEIGELMPLAHNRIPAELTDFCRRFTLRYDTKEVRLLEALDPDRGIGYGDTRSAYRSGSSLLQNLGLNAPRTGDQLADNLLHIMMRQGTIDPTHTPVIELSAEDVRSLAKVTPPEQLDSATTGYIMGQFLAPSTTALDRGDFLFRLQTASVRSALPLLARFCHLDEQLETKLRQCAEMEDQASPDICLAEIVFIPDDRMGNIMLRPALRKHELVLAGHGATADESSIPVADLFVSVVNSRVILRSEKLDKVIVPRLSCAHNYRTGTSLYRFLCDLQHQSHSFSINWDWGAYSAYDFLPRITYKHVVLKRARWRIPAPPDPLFFQQQPLVAVAELRSRHNLPAEVLLTEGDNELLLDLAHFAAAEILIKHLKSAPVILYENLATQGNSPVKGRCGNPFYNEVIIPFKTNGQLPLPSKPPAPPPTVRRSFPPGSEWVYLKLYMGPGECDRVLTGQVNGFLTQLKQAGWLNKWFFTRYADPEHHLRIRILLRPKDGQLPWQGFSDCASQFFAPAVDQGLIYRIQYDTYERELERYGGTAITACETVFHLDSEATLAWLPQSATDASERNRLVYAMIAIDDLLESFGLQPADKLKWVMSWSESFFREFGSAKSLKLNLDKKFRENRLVIERQFHASLRHVDKSAPLGKRFDALKALDAKPWITPQIAASLSHMFVNRHFHTEQREMELILYHFLTKCYRANQYQNDGVIRF
ncbi:lantibiotic dehydratase [Parapedobacter sp. 10938]|uniref:lantibiotic dehydratase n=1 Tax=Parapedobacter flavus TaxID=3110225 RepID=UPI002DBA2BBC|nr:lantibiotic dehydratase [Parapedobacter sp. 10938]MEC3878626.1 lantibiotic dehydratase [Parapedobacter sp. 10938]